MASELDIDWLTSAAAVPWLEMATCAIDRPLALAARLRKGLPAERARLVAEQGELRRRAAKKFSTAERMFFTAQGLEQATDEVVARYKAARFSKSAAVADLCCGIGGDLMALARLGPTVGIERDRTTAAFAEENLRSTTARHAGELAPGRCGVSRVVIADAANFDASGFTAWHLDPDRRPTGRRTTHVELHEPGPHVIARLLAECPNAALKLAPAAVFDLPIPDASAPSATKIPWHEAELEWISRKRQCRQLVAWFGSLGRSAGQRRATLLANELSTATEDVVVATFEGRPGVELPAAARIGRFVFEPDAAVLAGDLTGALAAKYGLQWVAAGVAYLTADEPCDCSLLAEFEVLETMPYRPKHVKAWLRARGIGRLEVKKRGVDLDPRRIQAELQSVGDTEATLLLCRLSGKTTAILARPNR
jgi:hypothetical protein